MSLAYSRQYHLSFSEKVRRFSFSLFWGVLLLCGISLLMLFSVGVVPCESSGCEPHFGYWFPYASKQFVRFGIGFVAFFFLAFSSLRTWAKTAYLLYALSFIALLIVTFAGHEGMGAQRWISIGGFIFQPSEPMKITLVLALARYFSTVDIKEIHSVRFFLGGIAFIAAPVALVLMQPDLGTALMLVMLGGVMFFISGIPLSRFGVIFLVFIFSLPVIWNVGLHDYQKQRILTFITPDHDSAGAGYHITQSKIALGSGGWSGKGYLNGSQSHLNFLPEKQTDFIFTMYAEEFGFLGSFLLLLLYSFVIGWSFFISFKARSRFSNLLGIGLVVNFALYVFINIAMVTGLIPVVGVPLPLISYGGSSSLSLLIGFGLLESIAVHRDMLS